jgi:hypothetical protein
LKSDFGAILTTVSLGSVIIKLAGFIFTFVETNMLSQFVTFSINTDEIVSFLVISLALLILTNTIITLNLLGMIIFHMFRSRSCPLTVSDARNCQRRGYPITGKLMLQLIENKAQVNNFQPGCYSDSPFQNGGDLNIDEIIRFEQLVSTNPLALEHYNINAYGEVIGK